MGTDRTLRFATYNVHGGLRPGRAFEVGPTCRVVAALECDVLGLQEVADLSPASGLDAFDALATAHGGSALRAPTLIDTGRTYGNALLSRLAIRRFTIHDLSIPGREPRNLIDAEVDAAGRPVRVLTTHLGLAPRERRLQADRIAALLREAPGEPTVLMGDFNDWLPTSLLSRTFDALLPDTQRRATFPARLPLLALDRIWVRPQPASLELTSVRSADARTASDHLPLVAKLRW